MKAGSDVQIQYIIKKHDMIQFLVVYMISDTILQEEEMFFSTALISRIMESVDPSLPSKRSHVPPTTGITKSSSPASAETSAGSETPGVYRFPRGEASQFTYLTSTW